MAFGFFVFLQNLNKFVTPDIWELQFDKHN